MRVALVSSNSYGLSGRELQILHLIGEGYSNRGIAEQLIISQRTVERHVSVIMHKMHLSGSPNVNNRVLAAVTWLRSQYSST
ncbi:LuxR C-terminal-related transcriptional regulator [Streptomyces sp. NBC_01142]|uniref:LuxR C-terminal-related transcriptional regulator n=1 Tax=Streptomyces sp. NBC_01142 TaxID=2975865 RepID=UPI00338EFEFE